MSVTCIHHPAKKRAALSLLLLVAGCSETAPLDAHLDTRPAISAAATPKKDSMDSMEDTSLTGIVPPLWRVGQTWTLEQSTWINRTLEGANDRDRRRADRADAVE